MRLASLFPHGRLQSQIDAFIDAELPDKQRVRLERHIEDCLVCRSAVEQGRSLKGLLAALPPVEPARSFRLTPDMVASPGRAPAARSNVPTMRLAQVSAAVALTAFVAVLSIDVFGADDSADNDLQASGLTATSAEDSAAPATRNALSSGGAPAASGGASSSAATSPAVPPPGSGGIGAQSNPSPGPASSAPESAKNAPLSPETPTSNSSDDRYSADSAVDEGPAVAAPASQQESGLSGLQLAEIVLLGVAGLALVAWAFLARSKRRA